jgi:tetratricopeptide (TPR) repeat protein
MFLYWGAGGYLSEGRGALEEALARGTSASELVQARAMVAAANVAWRQGDEARTEELATTAIPILEDAGDRRALADALNARAIAAEWRGDLEAEDRLQAQVEAIHRELGNARGLATILGNRGYAAIILGDYERAERLLRESVSLLEPDDRNFAWHFLNVGLALLRQRRLPEARSAFRQSLEHPNADTEFVFYALEGLANVAAAEGDDLRAARLWGASELIRERTGAKLARAEQELHDELVPKAQERAGAAAFDRAWADARLLTEEQAIALALGDSATPPAAS